MDSEPSKPTRMMESSTRERSDFTHSRRATPPASTEIPREIRERTKPLKILHEDEGVPFGPDPTTEAELADRFSVATKLRTNRLKQVFVAIRRARDVQLCFLIDVTGSMQPSIDGVRASIYDIVKKLTQDRPAGGKGESEARSMALAFVAYRDIGDSKRFEVLSFTSNVEEFTDFCGRLNATGGGDQCEDVFGGLDTALNLPWSDNCGSKAIFHICDAPCHGREFYSSASDDYPAGDPNGRTCKELFSRLRGKGIQYHFGKLNPSTDVMIQKFSEAYGEPIVKFDTKDVATITASVIRAVTDTIATMIATSSRVVGVTRADRPFKLDPTEPDWSSIREVKGQFGSYEFPKSIKDIEDDVLMVRKKMKSAIVKIANNPFGNGAERIAYYGMDVSTYVEKPKGGAKPSSKPRSGSSSVESEMTVLTKNEAIVVKEYRRIGKDMNAARRYEMSNQMQTIASYLALEFCNDLKKKTGISKTIKFIKIRTLYMDGPPLRFMSCEKRFSASDKFVRFTNNTEYSIMEAKAVALGVSTEFVKLVIAFSHWTFKATNGFLMVVDLQGVVAKIGGLGDTGVLLTDPAIHCKDVTRYGPMNHGPGGMKNYFASHECNDFCKKLGLDTFKC